jgi:hypothetical protein
MSPHRAKPTRITWKRSIRRPTLTGAATAMLAALAIAAAGCGGAAYGGGKAPSHLGVDTPVSQGSAASSSTAGIPQNNGGDHDADNNGGPSDGDGQI